MYQLAIKLNLKSVLLNPNAIIPTGMGHAKYQFKKLLRYIEGVNATGNYSILCKTSI